METELTRSIVRRALAFAATLNWDSPLLKSVEPANNDIVAKYGTPGHTVYMAVTIETHWSPLARERILARVSTADRAATERILDSPRTVVVTCSETDIIDHHFPGIDLD